MKSHEHVTALIGVLVAGLILSIGAVWPLSATRGTLGPGRSSSRLASAGVDSVNGEYFGAVQLTGVFNGEHDDATPGPVSPVDLGSIELVLDLSQAADAVTGYVALARTDDNSTNEASSLVFAIEHTVDASAVGPMVNGTFDGSTLELTSEQFSSTVAGRLVTRQFSLTSTEVQSHPDAHTIVGEYRETLWGFTPHPVTAVGTFNLSRPVFSTGGTPGPEITPTSGPEITPTPGPFLNRLYLPLAARSTDRP
jgi:hypothetical protein